MNKIQENIDEVHEELYQAKIALLGDDFDSEQEDKFEIAIGIAMRLGELYVYKHLKETEDEH